MFSFARITNLIVETVVYMDEILSTTIKSTKISKCLLLIITYLLLFLPNTLKSQCGTHLIPSNFIDFNFINFSNSGKKFTPSDTVNFPIQFHVVVSDKNQTDSSDINAALSYTNQLFSATKLKFNSCNLPNYIYSSSLEIIRNQTQENALVDAHELPGMINVFIVDSVYIGTVPQCGYAYLPGGPLRIIMSSACLLPPSNTLAHELGHIFSLLHTHGMSNTDLTDELVNQSNCAEAGDYLCDTPADPNLANKVSQLCNYYWQEKDANGDIFTPDVNNIMSYTRDKCALHFSNQQAIQMYNAAYYYNLVNTTCYNENEIVEETLEVFPNPIENYCTVEFSVIKSGNYTVTVVDVLGSTRKTLLNQNLKVGRYKLIDNDWANFNLGVYFIVLANRDGSRSIKVIKN